MLLSWDDHLSQLKPVVLVETVTVLSDPSPFLAPWTVLIQACSWKHLRADISPSVFTLWPYWSTATNINYYIAFLGISDQVALVVKSLPTNERTTEDTGLIPGLGRSSGGGHGNPLQYSCLENSHGQKSLVGYSPWGHKKSDPTEVT